MNISLPKTLRSFVDERVEALSYSSASEYICELIRKDRERRASGERLEELLFEGLKSGPAAEWTEDDWAALRKRVAEHVEAKKRAGRRSQLSEALAEGLGQADRGELLDGPEVCRGGAEVRAASQKRWPAIAPA